MASKVYLTPGEKREKAKAKAALDVRRIKAEAARLRKEMRDMKKKVTKPDPGPAGRIKDPEVVGTLPKVMQEIADENILFRPNEGPQTEFLSAPETDVLYGGAAGGGKSYALLVDPLRYAHIKQHRALILRKTLGELRELINTSRELYPKAFPGSKYKETEKIWTFPSGATLEFGYLDKESDVYRYQGQAFSYIAFDEITHLTTEFPWNYLASRLRTTVPEIIPYMRATANPGGTGHAWVKARYITPANHNTSFIGEDGISRRFIPARLSDNPHLASDGRYEKMLESLPEVHRKRLLEGDWDVNEGAAFSEFSKVEHVCDPFFIPPHWNRVKGIDYGYSSPSACVWGAVDPDDGTLFIYREFYRKGLTGYQLAKELTECERDEMHGIPGVLDTAAWNHTGYSGPTIGEQLCRGPYGHKLRPADKNRLGGKIQIHEYLKTNPKSGRPKLIIFNTCVDLIRELSSLPLDKTRTEDVDTHCDDHAYDALRYLIMSRPRQMTMMDSGFTFKQDAARQSVDNFFHPYS